MPETANVRGKRALLIGIDAYRHVPQLDGCVNDVRLMQSVLIGAFAFAADAVTVLANEQATREGILEAFDALVAATGQDDVVVIHYAGHGSQMTDREGDEPSGFDSTIMPFDTGRAPHENRDITDDEIHLKLEALGERTSYTTLIFDACHSGTITRDVFGAKARAVESDRRPVAELPPSPIPVALRSRRRAESPSGWLPLTEKYVLIAGCRDEERSYEYRPPESHGTVVHGALTFFLCEQLRHPALNASYRDVFERAAARVNAENSEQHPQMEGHADREVFGVADFTPATFVLVTRRDGSTVMLAAGAAHGLTIGSTYAVYPQGTKQPEGVDPIGQIRIAAIGVVTADASVVAETSTGAIGHGSRGFETDHAYGDFRLAVQCVAAAGREKHTATLAGLLEKSRLLKVVPESALAAARIYLLDARSGVAVPAPVPQAGPLEAPCWAPVSATGDLLMPLKALGDEASVVENLETIARYRQALSLENPDPASHLKGRFAVDPLRQANDGSWSVAQAESDGGQIVFHEGDAIAFRITSRHHEAVYFSLLDFGLTGAISQVFPPRHAQDALAPGMTYDIGTQGQTPSRLTWPAGHPFVDSADHSREAEGIETLRLFVTEQPADFFALQQHGVRAIPTAQPSPLASLLRGAFHGMGTRDIAMSAVGAEDWTTVSRSFVLKRRTSAALPADGAPIEIGTARVAAKGLSGTVLSGFGKRGREQADRLVEDALHRALDAAGIETRQTIEIANARELGPSGRSVGAQPALELRLRDPGAGYGQMVLAADELGVVSWSFAPPAPRLASTRGMESARPARTYVVPRTVPSSVPPKAGERGIVGVLGKKFLKELVFPLVDPVLGEVSETFVNRLEQRRCPYRVRTFTPDDYARDETSEIDRDGWSRFASGRALLMVHGTFSRTHLAFAQLPKEYVETLYRRYEGRVLAVDHFTLSHDPKENVRWLLNQIPDGTSLTLDIISHSRGGIVSRLLSEKQAEFSLGARRLRIGKVVLVGVPSAGTALADPEHVREALDIFTNLMNFLPDNGVTDVMTMIVEVAKQVAVGALGGLEGLQAMRPRGEFARWMNAGPRSGETKYFAVASDVTPSDPGLRHFAVTLGLNTLLQGTNDFVVPTESVFAANGSGFFPIDERLVLEGAGAAAHTRYFDDERVRRKILEWLTA